MRAGNAVQLQSSHREWSGTELNSQEEKVGMGRERDRKICESLKV